MAPSTRRSARKTTTKKSSPTSVGDFEDKLEMGSSTGSKTGVTSSSEIDCDNNSAKKRRVTFSMDVSTPASPSVSDISSQNRAKVSARAQRSLRRQANIETVAAKVVPRSAAAIKRGRKQSPATSSKRGKPADDEEVVKIKLNTGTLYMYRGLNRRVMFVRRL
uniref:Uncharacterized protein n=1 Tax=Eucampia antarctica TaxID=49252 RepID=A0A7S2S868_9STRA|mmetsp:Transcript_4427/g.4197  ORF Transcript_4427/g.4197 Transcript_4427/m.4197 type:complete len:163 (+) Transcript_4427:110-598(+)|eukprot:CAMPEP_0197831634 /NCGR_PEP_ID=MMETSP1437-20131217/11387_1 /TAXON_ID=49252 ORGANISM="Eucampia antarctica, Strain CCMP1452" /NCGR_SAMPLE_ID=MMETSP1437 /ASSEMBLY_ACC=CAM_ASM_001096 /LENGTH=162 /DNA_ID=CAMNT_0043434645 /DNA_START=107 /DNA_END=595 /DNA_ORIENTATION=-